MAGLWYKVKMIRWALGAAMSVVVVLGLTPTASGGQSTITVRGSTTVLPVAQGAAEVFMDRNQEVDISVQGGGSGVGISSMIEGTCDIADSSRAVKDDEVVLARSKGIEFKANVIAMDGIAVIVHPTNKAERLSKSQIKEIYTGKISRWSSVGGADQAMVVVSRDNASGTFEAFDELALDKEKVRRDALMQGSNQAVATAVATSPGAIGYVGLAYLSLRVKPVIVDGVAASKDTVLLKRYALSRPLYMYTNGEPKGVVKEYIDFILSEEGQKLVEELGFVGIR
jgi:phosphate transport system substrate-binding protein